VILSNETIIDVSDDFLTQPTFELIEGIMGIELGPNYDKINFDESCENNSTLEASGPCMRIRGDLVIHIVDNDANPAPLIYQVEQRLIEGMNEDWYTCSNEKLI